MTAKATLEKYTKPQPYLGFIARFPRAMAAVAEESVSGCKKHEVPMTDISALGLPGCETLYREALVRHLLRERIEGPVDPEFGHLHVAHMAWDILTVLERMLLDIEQELEQAGASTKGETNDPSRNAQRPEEL